MKSTEGFCRIFEDEGVRITHTAYRAPNQNAYCERAIVLFRSAQHTPNLPNFRRLPSLRIPNSELRISKVIPKGPTEIVCHERLGGLIKSYERRAV
jgi:hypothetical protein